jgi:hypothetical protein
MFVLTGTIPLGAMDQIAALKYWTLLPSKDHILRHVYDALRSDFKNNPTSKNWAAYIYSLLKFYGDHPTDQVWDEHGPETMDEQESISETLAAPVSPSPSAYQQPQTSAEGAGRGQDLEGVPNTPETSRINPTNQFVDVLHDTDDIDEIWNTQTRPWSPSEIEDRVRKKSLELLFADIADKPSLAFFRATNIQFDTNRALEILDKRDRNNMIRMLLGTHNLAIRAGRLANREIYDRKCQREMEETEDEQHFLFECSINSEEREKLREKLGRIGRDWDMETWIWMHAKSLFVETGEEKTKRSAMRMAARFITVSLGRRDEDEENENNGLWENDEDEDNLIDVCSPQGDRDIVI